MKGPLQSKYGRYRLVLRKADHIDVHTVRPTPHVEVWKGHRKVGNYHMASRRLHFRPSQRVSGWIQQGLRDYLHDPEVKRKLKQMIEESYFDLSKPIGRYGGIPRGFKATITVEFTEESIARRFKYH